MNRSDPPAVPPVGEDDLQAYLDGRLSADRRDAVQRTLADHPDLASKLARDGEMLAELRERLAFKAAEPMPARLRVASIRADLSRRRMAGLRSAAAVCAWLAIGGVGGFVAKDLLSSRADDPVRVARMADEAIRAHRTFVVEVAHPVEVRASEEAHLVGWLSKRLQTPIKVPELSSLGYRLMGGRLLPGAKGPAAMLMYDNDAGTRLTLYVKTDETEETGFQFVEEEGFSAFLWRDRGLGYVVTAASPREALMPIARLVYDELDKPPDAGRRTSL